MAAHGNPIVMPKLGLTMAEGIVAEWLVGVGDTVSAGQTIFVVETDKISHEIEATASGEIVALLAARGDTIPVGGVVATWTGPGQGRDSAHTPDTAAAGADDATTDGSPPQAALREAKGLGISGNRHVATPLARRLAAASQIDLDAIMPSGGSGRIKARDVHAAVSHRMREAPGVADGDPGGVPASAIRRMIADRLTRSMTEIPHFTVATEADIGRLESLRAELNASGVGTKLSITHFLVAAIGRAMAAHRHLNAVWRGGTRMQLQDVAVGVAVDTEAGVRMPVIVGADHRSLDTLAAAITDAAQRSRAGRLRASDMAPAAISLSNVGMFGVSSLVPIIDPDQSFIIGAGGARAVFRPDAAGAPAARREITLTLAGDHRLVDGAAGAVLLQAVAGYLEAPLQLLRGPDGI